MQPKSSIRKQMQIGRLGLGNQAGKQKSWRAAPPIRLARLSPGWEFLQIRFSFARDT
jgi:hypothetical protein